MAGWVVSSADLALVLMKMQKEEDGRVVHVQVNKTQMEEMGGE